MWRAYGVDKMRAQEILTFGATPLQMRLIKDVLPNDIALSKASSRALEIGAGTCHASYLIKRASADHIFMVATDVSSAALRAGKRLMSVFGRELDGYICCDCTRLPFADQSFDLVFGSSVLHHLERPIDACTEIRRVLGFGGRYIGMEGAVNRMLKPLVRVIGGARHRESSEGVREDIYDLDSWGEMFREAGMYPMVEPLVSPAAYRDLVVMKVIPSAYRPRYKLRYPYERLLGLFPKHIVRGMLRLLPGSVVITAIRTRRDS